MGSIRLGLSAAVLFPLFLPVFSFLPWTAPAVVGSKSVAVAPQGQLSCHPKSCPTLLLHDKFLLP